jgi:hypothetical protein
VSRQLSMAVRCLQSKDFANLCICAINNCSS